MDLLKLMAVLRLSWDEASAFRAEDWTVDNPARGQCAVSSLVVQDYMGGEIVRLAVEFAGISEKHFVNMIEGVMVDATFSQFPEDVAMWVSPPDLTGFGSVRERLLSDEDTARRYEYLKGKVGELLVEG